MEEKGKKSHAKRAILDPKVEERILEAADPVTQRPAIWLMMKIGMHPRNVAILSLQNLQKDEQGWWLQYIRVKNENARRELLPVDVGQSLEAYLKRKGRPRTRQAFWAMALSVARKAGVDDFSPMTLRHTACINFLRQYRSHPERMELVAKRMGCTRDVVIQNYLDLEAWEGMR